MPPPPGMGYDRELIRDVRRRADLKLDAVACATGYSRSAIHQYENGPLTVPYDYAARLYQMTGDLRLGAFVCSGVIMVKPAQTHVEQPDDDLKMLLPLELHAIEFAASAARELEAIVHDGQIDARDDSRRLKLEFAHEQIWAITSKVHQILMRQRQRTDPPARPRRVRPGSNGHGRLA